MRYLWLTIIACTACAFAQDPTPTKDQLDALQKSIDKQVTENARDRVDALEVARLVAVRRQAELHLSSIIGIEVKDDGSFVHLWGDGQISYREKLVFRAMKESLFLCLLNESDMGEKPNRRGEFMMMMTPDTRGGRQDKAVPFFLILEKVIAGNATPKEKRRVADFAATLRRCNPPSDREK